MTSQEQHGFSYENRKDYKDVAQAVSYTHLDVYKRQSLGSCHNINIICVSYDLDYLCSNVELFDILIMFDIIMISLMFYALHVDALIKISLIVSCP